MIINHGIDYIIDLNGIIMMDNHGIVMIWMITIG